MTSVLKKSRGTKGKSVSMQEDLPSRWGTVSHGHNSEETAELMKFIDESVIGKGNSFCGPFGRRKVVYCDYSGSGRALHWLEEHVTRHVLPAHGTQCTALAHASAQRQLYREESRAIIRSSVGAHEDDAVVLGSSLPRLLRALRPARPTVFVSSRETERQLTPWRDCDAEIIKIPETKEGFIDLNNLEQRLQEKSTTGKQMIGFFAAASKLTGVLADDVATTLLLHQYGAWAFWDYTLLAPYTAVDMNPTFPGVEEHMVKKDVVFFNCEKFIGGVQGPNVAVVKRDVFRDTPVYSDDVDELSERLEESRCVDAVRAALVMRLRDVVGLQTIAERQDKITRQVLAHIKNIPELILLGSESSTARRLPIFSLMVKHPRGTFLHHNFVCAVLNDVFGIQARGGLSSNLTYGQDVLGIDDNLLKEYEKLLDVEAQKEIARARKLSDAKAPEVPIHNEHMRPGFSRISLPYFMSESELAFVLEALKMVATEGWKILPQYLVNYETGQWKHHSNSIFRDRKSLYSVRFHDGKMTANERKISGSGIFPQTYTECLQTARNLFNRARKLAMKCSTAEPEMSFNPRIDYLRWFMLPKEAHELLLGKSANVKHIVPFDPSGYTGARKSLITSRSAITSSPILGSSPRHFSLSALDDCQILRLKQTQKFYSRESSLKENQIDNTVSAKIPKSPVQFALGDSVSPIHLKTHAAIQSTLVRSRCYSLGSDSPPVDLSAEAKLNLGLQKFTSSVKNENPSSYCHCGSQTDLQSLDDPMISPTKPYSYISHNSLSDYSHFGRSSPTASLTSQNSEDLHAYVKEMTKEIATEIKSEIREVISQVDDILENSDLIDQSNLSINSISSQDRNSVSVIDVAEYLMGMSKEMASEVKYEIREMVNQVDEMISPDYNGTGSRKSSPPQTARRRIGSGPDLGLDLKRSSQRLKKCPTSPLLPSQSINEEDAKFFKRSPLSSLQSPKSAQRTPSVDTSGPSSVSFSSDTSTPDTIVQVVTSSSPSMPKSLSSNKLSDEEVCCSDVSCRQCCNKKNWCQNPSVSSQDSGINMTFTETDSYSDLVKWRTSSDPTANQAKKLQGRLRMCHRQEKSEVPDIIEGVPVCASAHASRDGRVVYRSTGQTDQQNSSAASSKRSSRSSNASSVSSDRSSRSSGYGTDVQRLPAQHEHDSDDGDEYKCTADWCELDAAAGAGACDDAEDSSACSDTELSEFTCDDAPWHCPPKRVWKPALEAIKEYNMIRPGDKVLVCLSGGRESVALLHILHHYQFYARSKGIHFTIGALFVHEPQSEVDPLHLMAYCRTLGVKLVYQDKIDETELDKRNTTKPLEAHHWATHTVRRRAYSAASANGYHVAAVAQHLDHAARAFLANAFHCGALRTMKAHYRVKEHEVRIIRPLIYVRECHLDQFSCARRLPDFRGDSAMHEMRSRRHHSDSDEGNANENKESVTLERSVSDTVTTPTTAPVATARRALDHHERLNPELFSSLKRALHPLISSRNIEKDLKEIRHRKKSVIQMKNGAPVYDSEEGTDEEPVS